MSSANENQVLIVSDDGIVAEVQVLNVSVTQLRVRVPFAAGRGRIVMRTARGEALSNPISVRTSASGFVERVVTQNDGSVIRLPIVGARVRLNGNTASERLTNEQGAFVLPDMQASLRAEFEILPPTNGALNFPPKRPLLRVVANRNNQFAHGDEQTLITGAQSLLAGEAGFSEIELAGNASAVAQNFTVTYLLPGRTPTNLPPSHFSSAIAQVTPFGAITPGVKLTLPNRDNLRLGTRARLFKFGQTSGRAMLGTFIDSGAATITANGFETAANAITEGSFYFTSIPRQTATLYGRVVESTGRPVSRAIVQTRGQSTFIDGFGGLVLRDVPVLAASSDQAHVEVSFLRPDATIARKARLNVPLTPNDLTEAAPEIVFDPVTTNRARILLVPTSLVIEAGRISDFYFSVSDPDAGQTGQVNVGGVSFARIPQPNCTNCILRLTPGQAVTGDFTLSLRAQDSTSAANTQTIVLRVNAPSALTVYDQAIVTDEDIAQIITLTSNDANAGFVIVTPPQQMAA